MVCNRNGLRGLPNWDFGLNPWGCTLKRYRPMLRYPQIPTWGAHTVDDLNPTSPSEYYTTISPRVLACFGR